MFSGTKRSKERRKREKTQGDHHGLVQLTLRVAPKDLNEEIFFTLIITPVVSFLMTEKNVKIEKKTLGFCGRLRFSTRHKEKK